MVSVRKALGKAVARPCALRRTKLPHQTCATPRPSTTTSDHSASQKVSIRPQKVAVIATVLTTLPRITSGNSRRTAVICIARK